MAIKTETAVASDYEQARAEKIAKNQALLQQLQLDAAQTGISKPKAKPTSTAGQKRKKPSTSQRVKIEEPRRTSARLQGIVADSEVARQKEEVEAERYQEQVRIKRQRVSEDINLSDAVVNGQTWDRAGNWLRLFGPAEPGVRTFDIKDEDVKAEGGEATDKDVKSLRERLGGLKLWEDLEPGRIKITPERIYSLGFHPSEEKPLVFAGDKLGNLGLFDGSQTASTNADVKAEPNEDGEEADVFEPAISTFKLHTRTISAFQFAPSDPNALLSCSYDSSIRKLDLQKGTAIEVYAPLDKSADEPLSGVEISRQDPNTLHFTTLDGRFGTHDLRTPAHEKAGEMFQLSEKKIGGFSLHPLNPHIVVTASLDRTIKLWDLRKIAGRGENRLPLLLGEHESRLSVSHAAFNPAGQVATASYDDTVKIYDFSSLNTVSAPSPTAVPEAAMTPKTIIPHNNQTGRWVTILRAQWQSAPQDGIQKFAIGNMNRFVDVYTAAGKQVAQLGGEGVTAVPAVAQFHPSRMWVGAGTASGKLCLWV